MLASQSSAPWGRTAFARGPNPLLLTSPGRVLLSQCPLANMEFVLRQFYLSNLHSLAVGGHAVYALGLLQLSFEARSARGGTLRLWPGASSDMEGSLDPFAASSRG